jgi:DNA (cytosine-5)-methyltransferase 1
MRVGSLFSGIGGLDLGFEAAGFEIVWHCEVDDYGSSILSKHWPGSKNLGDIRQVDWSAVDPVDVLIGGSPCQDISHAGKRAGITGEKSSLWFEYERAIDGLKPQIVIEENVSGMVTLGLDSVVGGLERLGYRCYGRLLRASDVGAPHKRERIFVIGIRADVADSESEGLPESENSKRMFGTQDVTGHKHCGMAGRESSCCRSTQSGLGESTDGFPRRLDFTRWPAGRGVPQKDWEAPRTTTEKQLRKQRLMALGNAVVPQCAFLVAEKVREDVNMNNSTRRVREPASVAGPNPTSARNGVIVLVYHGRRTRMGTLLSPSPIHAVARRLLPRHGTRYVLTAWKDRHQGHGYPLCLGVMLPQEYRQEDPAGKYMVGSSSTQVIA